MFSKLKNKVGAKIATAKRNKEKKRQGDRQPNYAYGENDDFGFMDELDSHETYTVAQTQPV